MTRDTQALQAILMQDAGQDTALAVSEFLALKRFGAKDADPDALTTEERNAMVEAGRTAGAILQAARKIAARADLIDHPAIDALDCLLDATEGLLAAVLLENEDASVLGEPVRP